MVAEDSRKEFEQFFLMDNKDNEARIASDDSNLKSSSSDDVLGEASTSVAGRSSVLNSVDNDKNDSSKLSSSSVSTPVTPPLADRPLYPKPSEIDNASNFATKTTTTSTQNSSVLDSPSSASLPPRQNFTPFDEFEKSKSGGSWFWKLLVGFVIGALVTTLAFSSAYYLFEDGNSSSSKPAASSVVSTAITEPGKKTNLVEPVGEEPAINVAEALSPAVVQVETSSNNSPLGAGSGVVYKKDTIITNKHVIEGADQIRIRLTTGKVLVGKVIGEDARLDIAVIEVKDSGLSVAQLADSTQVRVGQTAIAIGSPFLLQKSVTAGIVSAVNRPIPSIEGGTFIPMIQTDAPINQGNSGGALADSQGRVIGINTSIQTDGSTSTNAGVGFAIPINFAVKAADLLVDGVELKSGFLGVLGDPQDLGESGVRIKEVTRGSAADKAGLKAGDRVLSVDGAPVSRFEELAGLVTVRSPGEEVVLGIIRNDKEMTINVTLGDR